MTLTPTRRGKNAAHHLFAARAMSVANFRENDSPRRPGGLSPMSDDRLEWLHAAVNAVSRLDSDEPELRDARCPKCNASAFVSAADLYYQSAAHLEDEPNSAPVVRAGGMTDEQIVRRLRPPGRRSALRIGVLVAIPLSAAAFYLFRRFGQNVGEFAFVADFLVTLVVFMTRLRRYSDEYYDRRKQWRSLFVCSRCGQLVA